MSKTMLKYCRILIPGILIFISCYLLILEDISNMKDLFDSWQDFLNLAIILFSGGIYYTLNIRKPFIKRTLLEINNNIKNRLLEPFGNEPEISSKETSLRADRKLVDIFYHFIDNDESLKSRQKDVYMNGLIWSSIADIMAICIISAVVNIIAFLILHREHYLIVSLVCICIYILAKFLFMPLAVRKHIAYSNEQLDFILQHYSNDLRKKIKEVLQ